MTANVYSRKDATAMMGAGYHRAAFPANDQGGKLRVMVDKTSSLERVADLVDERASLDYEIEGTIGAALTAGASWADIGTALGMARQNAQRKYARARLTYASQPEEERARLDRLAGVGLRRITFEVRASGTDACISRHFSAEAAEKACGGLEVWKVYPQGRTVRIRSAQI